MWWRRSRRRSAPLSLADVDDETFLRLAYEAILRRPPDEFGTTFFRRALREGMSRQRVLDTLLFSDAVIDEVLATNLGESLHQSRKRFIRSLPRAGRILDLGGAASDRPEGALVAMGYPYRFDELVIIDLPNEQRHALYRSQQTPKVVESPRGPIRYHYGSLADLSPFADASFDLVYSGQSIEHVTLEEGAHVFREVRRVLRRGGAFALDTPNARATRLQQETFIDPDHRVEYQHAEVLALALGAGLALERAHGLNYLGACFERGAFEPAEAARHPGLFDAIEDCYLLAYVFRKLA
jgi:SAM-dependent methyltransferase